MAELAEPSAAAVSPLARRLILTLLLLAVSRIPATIPLPGISPGTALLASWHPGSMIRFSLGSLGVQPYVEAWVIMHLIHAFMPIGASAKHPGVPAAARLERAVRYLTLALAFLHGLAVGEALDRGGFVSGASAFPLTAALALAATVLFLVWLGDKITRHGVGHGIPLLIAASFLISLPDHAESTFETMRSLIASDKGIVGLLVTIVATVLITGFVAGARYRLTAPADDRAKPISLALVPAGLIAVLCSQAAAHFLNHELLMLIRTFEPDAADLRINTNLLTLVLSPLIFLSAAIAFDPLLRDPVALAEASQKRGGEITAARIRGLTLVLSALGGVLLALFVDLLDIVAKAAQLRRPITGGELMILTFVILACFSRNGAEER